MHRSIFILLFFLVGIDISTAHHGLDAYDTTRLIEISGLVVEFRPMDPHSLLVVETVNDNGVVTIWEVEGGSASGIIRSGLSQEFLRSMPKVKVKGFRAKDGSCAPRCSMAGDTFEFERD